MSKKWIPVNENGQLWQHEEHVQDGNSYICVFGYAVVLNNKPFTVSDMFKYTERHYEFSGGEVVGTKEIIYLV